MTDNSRRKFLKQGGALLAASTLPLTMVELAFGKGSEDKFTFAYISDSHITQIKGNKFVHN